MPINLVTDKGILYSYLIDTLEVNPEAVLFIGWPKSFK